VRPAVTQPSVNLIGRDPVLRRYAVTRVCVLRVRHLRKRALVEIGLRRSAYVAKRWSKCQAIFASKSVRTRRLSRTRARAEQPRVVGHIEQLRTHFDVPAATRVERDVAVKDPGTSIHAKFRSASRRDRNVGHVRVFGFSAAKSARSTKCVAASRERAHISCEEHKVRLRCVADRQQYEAECIMNSWEDLVFIFKVINRGEPSAANQIAK